MHESATQARRQDLAAGGAKNQKEGPKTRRGATFLKYSIGCMQQPVGQTWNGGAPISNGGSGTTGLPAGDGPAATYCCVSLVQTEQKEKLQTAKQLMFIMICGGLQKKWKCNFVMVNKSVTAKVRKLVIELAVSLWCSQGRNERGQGGVMVFLNHNMNAI